MVTMENGKEAVFVVFKASKLLAHYEKLKAITMIKPQMLDVALYNFLSRKYLLERALIYGKELIEDAEIE
ncbi:hypothetical protein HAX54_052285, partial [Datura stramonium]|nr:hypothetical protein [Datura stramonium]